MLSILLVASIALAVVLGYKTQINTGFFCMAFAYLLGCFGLGMSTKELVACWPTSTMFVILSVSLFYNFAAVNGTLEKCRPTCFIHAGNFRECFHSLYFSWQ